MGEKFGSLLPQRGDAERVLEAKILLTLNGGGAASAASVYTGSASPEGSVTAPVGSIYNQISGGVLTQAWVKLSGSGNTGWG